MRLVELYEHELQTAERREVIRAVYKYFRDHGVPNEKMSLEGTHLYIGGNPGSSPQRSYIHVTTAANQLSLGYFGDSPHYMEKTFNLASPDSFPNALDFVKARKDVIER